MKRVVSYDPTPKMAVIASARRAAIGEVVEVRHIPHGQPVEIKPGEAVEPLKGHHGRYGALAVRKVDDGDR